MILIEKPRFKDDLWCKCCNREDDSVMEIKFSIKENVDVSTAIGLCRDCRTELLVKLNDTVGPASPKGA